MKSNRMCPGCGEKIGSKRLFCEGCWRRAPLMLRLAYNRAATVTAQRLAYRGLLGWFKKGGD